MKQLQPKDLNLDDAPAKQCDVFLVDGNGLAYRAFYALPEELQTVEGLPTNALLGFANMLMRMLMDYRPRTVLVAWDEKPTDRLELAADYKAQPEADARPPAPAAAATSSRSSRRSATATCASRARRPTT